MYTWLKICSLGIQSWNSFLNLQAAWINYFVRHENTWQQFMTVLPAAIEKETCHCK